LLPDTADSPTIDAAGGDTDEPHLGTPQHNQNITAEGNSRPEVVGPGCHHSMLPFLGL
jgi:hypothetical protein